MIEGEEETFIENPFDSLFTVIPAMVLLFFVMAGVIGYFGIPPSRKDYHYTVESAIWTFFLIDAGIILLMLLLLSFQKKRTVVCDREGCRIDAANIWGFITPTESFLWKDVTATDLVLVFIGKGSYQLALQVTARGVQQKIFRRTWLRRKSFDRLLGVVNRSTPQLPYELDRTENTGARRVIEEVRDYCKAER